MSSKVIKARYYFVAPLRVTDWTSFSKEINEKEGWKRTTDANEFSLKEQVVGFLGMEKRDNVNGIVAEGEKWTRELQKSGNKAAFSYFKGDIKFYSEEKIKDAKGKVIDRVLKPIAGCNEKLTPYLVLELYISPNKRNALAVICLHLPDNETCSFEEVVNTNYHLHKTDVFKSERKLGDYQAPILFVKTGFDKEEKKDVYEFKEGCLTLAHVLKAALPSAGYELDNVARFHTATYVKIDASSDVNDKWLTDNLIHLGQSKDFTYEISLEERNNVVHLFENIWTYNSLEGFACVVKSHGDKDPDFIVNSESTFEKSYLPLFLTTLMADLTYTDGLRHINEVATSSEDRDRLREARLAVTLSVSHYDHLNRLMKSLTKNRDFDAKYIAIQSSIDSRRMQIEKAREKREESRARRIDCLLGFIGIGQVVFAILQLLGANNVMGVCVANSSILNIFSIVMLAIFTGLIIYLIVRLFTEQKSKTKNDAND